MPTSQVCPDHRMFRAEIRQPPGLRGKNSVIALAGPEKLPSSTTASMTCN
ncbi:hypothetical protein [Rhodoblastus sp.]